MFNRIKKCLAAFITAAVMTVSAVGCAIGESSAYAMTIDGYELRAGVYIFYQNSAFEEAKSKVQQNDSDIDVEDEDALKNAKIDGKSFTEWVNDKTMESCTQHVAVIRKFDEMKLSLDSEKEDSAKSYAANMAGEENDSNVYYLNGVGVESLKEIALNSFKSQAIFDAVYGEGGTEGVKEEDVKKYYLDNNVRAKFVSLDMHDSDGNELDDAGKKELEKKADEFLEEVKGLSGQELLDAFDNIQTEYDDYVASKTTGTTDSDTASETTATTVASTTAAEATEVEDAEDVEEESTQVEEVEDVEEAEDNGEAAVFDFDKVYAAETTAAETESTTTETEVTAETAAEETTAETVETTTTADPYANETIVSKVTTAKDSDKAAPVTYNPCKAVYDWLFDSNTKFEEPKVIKDDDGKTIYVAVKLDIEERMTSDDLWSDDNIEQVRFNKYNDAMQDKIEEWAKALTVEKNESAIDRYDPFGYKEPETTAAPKQTQPYGY